MAKSSSTEGNDQVKIQANTKTGINKLLAFGQNVISGA